MDPDATLTEIRACLQEGNVGSLDRASELFEALDSWLSRGGFLPAAWHPRTRDEALQRAAAAAMREVLEEVRDGKLLG